MTLMFEGTWEEMAQHAPEFSGRRLRVFTFEDEDTEALPVPPPEFTSQEELEALLLKGLNSGPPTRVTPEYWQQKEAMLLRRWAQKNAQP